MALPVGKPTENNKELELVASLLEKTLKELEETKNGFEKLGLKDEERQERFKTFVNQVLESINKKDFNPKIEVPPARVYINSEIEETVRKVIEPKRFWDFTGKELALLGTTFITIILLGFSLNYNFKTSKVLKSQNLIIAENQKKLFDIYRQESKFWYSKSHQKAYASSVVQGQIEKDIKADEKSFKEKLEEAKKKKK